MKLKLYYIYLLIENKILKIMKKLLMVVVLMFVVLFSFGGQYAVKESSDNFTLPVIMKLDVHAVSRYFSGESYITIGNSITPVNVTKECIDSYVTKYGFRRISPWEQDKKGDWSTQFNDNSAIIVANVSKNGSTLCFIAVDVTPYIKK